MSDTRSFESFKREMYARLQTAPHLRYLDHQLERIETYIATGGERGNGRLIVSMPPRHGKTFTVSRLFPAWIMALHPMKRIIMASYGASLANKNSRLVRNLMLSPVYQQWSNGVRPAKSGEGSASVQSWDIVDRGEVTGGGMDAVGVGGGITGKGAELIIVDDPIKSRAEAETHSRREKIWDWFTDDLYTRREPGAAVIVVMTRWHMDDLVGRLLLNMPGQWENIRLPALAEANDPLGRAVGEPLWTERFPLAALNETRKTLGEYAWAGLYQQQPTPSEGGFFKPSYFRIIDDEPSDLRRVVRYWDLAMTSGEHSDYSVGVKMGQTSSGDVVVLDVARFQKSWLEVTQRVLHTAQEDGADVYVGIEKAAQGKQVVDQLLKQFSGVWVGGFTPKGSKTVRALPLSAKAEAGQVYVLKRAWTESLIEELSAFPYAKHDDQVDATAGALEMLAGVQRRALKVETIRMV